MTTILLKVMLLIQRTLIDLCTLEYRRAHLHVLTRQ